MLACCTAFDFASCVEAIAKLRFRFCRQTARPNCRSASSSNANSLASGFCKHFHE